MSTETLLSEIETFLARTDVQMTETTFGRRATNDGHFISEIRRGRRVWPETAQKVRKFIADYRPGEAASHPPQAGASA